MSRIEPIRQLLADREADALYVTFLPDIRWACGFTGSNAVLIVRPDTAHFVTDGRYKAQAVHEVASAEIHVAGYDLVTYVAEAGLIGNGDRAVYQSDHVSVAALGELNERLGNVDWHGEKDLLVQLVASKTPEEIERIRAAQEVTDDVFDDLKGWLRAGLTEKEVAVEIVCQHLKRGAEKMSFDPIVASGPNSALPHARPTDRTLRDGDVVLLDFGCFLDGYASDMTRVVGLGTPDAFARNIYELVLAAQERALEAARPGMPSKDVDALAREVITEGGYGEAFSHGLGHGVGLQVHEWPRVSYSVDYPLPPDVVVSVEPGIYLQDQFGIRIEDLVVITSEGCRNLTKASKAWTIL